MKPQSIQDRSFDFACRIVRLTERLHRQKSFAASAIPDFISKCSIAAKEARETRYWLRLLIACSVTSSEQLSPLVIEAGEIVAILTTIVKNAQASKNRAARHSTFNIQH